MQRIEQSFLRKNLFGNKREAKCDICGKPYPVDFLVAAHIKRRADCSLEEKKDFENIVMSACKFGCDELYEKGYIIVSEGIIKANEKKYISPSIKPYMETIINHNCEKWNDRTKKYFMEHSFKFDK